MTLNVNPEYIVFSCTNEFHIQYLVAHANLCKSVFYFLMKSHINMCALDFLKEIQFQKHGFFISLRFSNISGKESPLILK